MNLFSPLDLGSLTLPNRLAMAPLTRLRAGENGVPGGLIAEHYAQRASLGLLISEGTYPSLESQSYAGQPGIVTEQQVEGWARVTEAVHQAGGRIFMQLMNGGRTGHSKISGIARTVAPSAIAISGEVRVGAEKLPHQTPHALTTSEVEQVRDEFAAAARRAIDAGFDGVEIHAANGYLVHQFLGPSSNVREDRYGGSPAARAQFGIEVVTAVAAEIGADKVGIRLSPEHNIQDVFETDPAETAATYHALLAGIAPLGLAYLSILHQNPEGEFVQDLRSRFAGVFMINSGFSSLTSRQEARMVVSDDIADVIAVGRPVIANPDLAERWLGDHPENEANPATFYAAGAEGYNDYPLLSA